MLQPKDALREEDEAADEAPLPGRRPRFEMRVEGSTATRTSMAKLGLSTAQGAVEDIKMYAANHAAKEGERAITLFPRASPTRTPRTLLYTQKTTDT